MRKKRIRIRKRTVKQRIKKPRQIICLRRRVFCVFILCFISIFFSCLICFTFVECFLFEEMQFPLLNIVYVWLYVQLFIKMFWCCAIQGSLVRFMHQNCIWICIWISQLLPAYKCIVRRNICSCENVCISILISGLGKDVPMTYFQ